MPTAALLEFKIVRLNVSCLQPKIGSHKTPKVQKTCQDNHLLVEFFAHPCNLCILLLIVFCIEWPTGTAATMVSTFPANEAFYRNVIFLGGVLFGASILTALINDTIVRLDTIVFFMLFFCCIAYLLMKKRKLELNGDMLYSLSRSNTLICADFLNSCSYTTWFSLIVYVYQEGFAVLNYKWEMHPSYIVLLINFIIFAVSMILYSFCGANERKVSPLSSNNSITPTEPEPQGASS